MYAAQKSSSSTQSLLKLAAGWVCTQRAVHSGRHPIESRGEAACARSKVVLWLWVHSPVLGCCLSVFTEAAFMPGSSQVKSSLFSPGSHTELSQWALLQNSSQRSGDRFPHQAEGIILKESTSAEVNQKKRVRNGFCEMSPWINPIVVLLCALFVNEKVKGRGKVM